MDQAVLDLLKSIKQRQYDENILKIFLGCARDGEYTFKLKALNPSKCFVCDNPIGSRAEQLPCEHKVCSVDCLIDEIGRRGPQGVCRHCLDPLVIEEGKQARPKHKPKFTCEVCTDEHLVEQSITLSCDHRFCNDCITGHLENLIEDGKVQSSQVKCPNAGCSTVITYNEAKSLLSSDTFERLDKLMASRFEFDDQTERIEQCPNKSCLFQFLIDKNVTSYQCPQCKTDYCSLCRNRAHGSSKCVKVNANASAEDRALIEMAKQLGWKQCPVCKTVIEKNEGCVFMVCQSEVCKGTTYFCYVCEKHLNEKHERHVCLGGKIAKPRCPLS
mmetsp:Transcript_5312/g.9741  ORF Transcript_5312/g.9741 Transcript_5312/m.9741 type:complete len:329 (+) Transcript_5312:3117-4103(+)